MLEITVDITSVMRGLNRLDQDIRDAWDAAVREVSLGMVVPAVQGLMGAEFHGSGRTRSQVQAKFFKNRATGLLQSSTRVRGDRSFVMHIQEFGSKTHGGRGAGRKLTPGAKGDRGPLPPKPIFASVWQAIHGAAEQALLAAFQRHLEGHLKVSGF